MDNFQTDFDKCEREINTLTMGLEEVVAIKKKDPSKPIVQQEFKMRQANIQIKSQILDLENLASEYQNSGSRFNLTAGNRQKRVDKIIMLKKTATSAMAGYDQYMANKQNSMGDGDLESQPMMALGQRGEDGDYDRTRDLDNKQILAQQKNHIGQQDNVIDGILAQTNVIKGQAQDFTVEAKQQNDQLDRVANDIEQTNDKMVKVDNDMKRLMQKANQKMCYGVLCCEVVLLFVFIFV